MPRSYNLSECFAEYGVKQKNVRWSWSARSETEVIMTFWLPGFKGGKRYESEALSPDAPWLNLPGNKERLENLIWAWDHGDRLLRVIVVVPRDESAPSWEIGECYPKPNMIMRITKLNRETGEFDAELVT